MQTSSEATGITARPTTSHSSRRQNRNKKASDPFLELPDEPVKLPDIPTTGRMHEDKGSHRDSLLADLVLTPLGMISFILSLFVVDRQQRAWRKSQHSSGNGTLYRLTHWSWLGPEPYQDSQSGAWGRRGSVAAQNPPDHLFLYTKKRRVAKMEISDAFEMRRRVILALLAWSLLGLYGITYATRRMYGWLFRA